MVGLDRKTKRGAMRGACADEISDELSVRWQASTCDPGNAVDVTFHFFADPVVFFFFVTLRLSHPRGLLIMGNHESVIMHFQ